MIDANFTAAEDRRRPEHVAAARTFIFHHNMKQFSPGCEAARLLAEQRLAFLERERENEARRG